MADVTEVRLPGVGVRHEFTTEDGERLSVLSHRSGRREVAIYDRADPDMCRTVLHLSPDDTRTMADLLGGSQVSEAVTAVQRLEGLAIDWITLKPGAASVGSTIGQLRLRTRTGASIVAVIRDESTLAAPGPEFAFEGGDVTVAMGTTDGLAALRSALGA
jgi:TrkA domain protein